MLKNGIKDKFFAICTLPLFLKKMKSKSVVRCKVIYLKYFSKNVTLLPHILQRITFATEVRNILGMFANHVQCKKEVKKKAENSTAAMPAIYIFPSSIFVRKKQHS